jgi:hypothetical protein
VVSNLLVHPELRSWFSNTPASADPSYLYLVLTSPAFIRQANKEFGAGRAKMMMWEIKEGLDRYAREQNNIQVLQQQQQPKESILAGALEPPPKKRVAPFLGSPMGQMQNSLVPAIRTMDGKIVKASANEKTHNDIIAKNKLKASDVDQRGFLDPDGNFYNREEAAQLTGLETNVQPGRLHSTDLPRAK